METTLYEYIGKKIREARENKSWTQSDLSTKVDLTRTSVTNIELGRQKIQIHVLYNFARALSISPHELLPQLDDLIGLALDNGDLPIKDAATPKALEFIQSMIEKMKEGEKNET
ncbi:hypothetical protein CBW65_07480 [Tumebacillus avium]|uniref:HTH cro/C1-type domain-containing protein n=1 Tax=Tumebacillus avium TaxID=1903704 RepID=A0A1Y0IKA9_9BACL|nr:helix-turn-helix transcriptional regulator [Tumebacillus avium]ARU60941.1 hypothetical protein CBW65_07480 [Tumebacillus avium]